ncbi:hypothetical protein U1Q18_006198 [Sarracenia purpurea var. burkii]
MESKGSRVVGKLQNFIFTFNFLGGDLREGVRDGREARGVHEMAGPVDGEGHSEAGFGGQFVASNDLKNSPGPSKKELRIATKQAVGILQDNYQEFVARTTTKELLSSRLFCFKEEDDEALLQQMKSIDPGMRDGSKVVAVALNKVCYACFFDFLPAEWVEII